MTAAAPLTLVDRIERALLQRNCEFEAFFALEADRIAVVSAEMAARFQRGGRILAFGRGANATDAQHVTVEFVHPVIIGKRALPALDLSHEFLPWVRSLVRKDDMVMGFGSGDADHEAASAFRFAQDLGAMTLGLPGNNATITFSRPNLHPFLHQEMIEILYHTLWETVHVFLEHQEIPSSSGEASFLYPFLGGDKHDESDLREDVASSVKAKVREDARLRTEVSRTQANSIAAASAAILSRLNQGGKLLLFGNGGSATDANDWAMDCVCPPPDYSPIPAISLSQEPATITALANDIGPDVIFLRQLIAHSTPQDVAIGISTSGGSRNIILALEEARRRGLLTVALLGYDGGEIVRSGLADHPIVVASDYIPRIQEVQASIYHIMRDLLELTRE